MYGDIDHNLSITTFDKKEPWPWNTIKADF